CIAPSPRRCPARAIVARLGRSGRRHGARGPPRAARVLEAVSVPRAPCCGSGGWPPKSPTAVGTLTRRWGAGRVAKGGVGGADLSPSLSPHGDCGGDPPGREEGMGYGARQRL